MTSYNDNPNLGYKVVTTYSGEQEYRINCKYINNIYYVKNKECFLIDDVWYRINSEKIAFDHETKQYVLKTANLIHGVVDIKEERIVKGYFSKNIYNNVTVIDYESGNKLIAINAEILLNNNYIEDIARCEWHPKSQLSIVHVHRFQQIRNEVDHHNGRGYTVESNSMDFEEKKESWKNYPLKIDKEVFKFSKFIGEVTFGFESETSAGNMSKADQYKNGIVICRDGSIQGAEFVSIPMHGAKGIQTICNTMDVLKKYTDIDINCSLHYHFGNINIDRCAIVTLYILAYKIQDEVFQMFPYYKTDYRGIKKHDYCAKYKKMEIHPLVDDSREGFESYINNLYRRIYVFFADGHEPDMNNNRRLSKHPVAHKWNQHGRRSWLNLCNMLFSERKTAEFRIATPTTNKIKAIAWFYMCVAIIRYAETHVKEILTQEKSISFEDVLNYYKNHFKDNKDAEFLSEYLIAYFKNQKERFAKDYEKGDYVSDWTISQDKTFKFSYKGISLFDKVEEVKEEVVQKIKVVKKKKEIKTVDNSLDNVEINTIENIATSGIDRVIPTDDFIEAISKEISTPKSKNFAKNVIVEFTAPEEYPF
jgi:hypothetical protein